MIVCLGEKKALENIINSDNNWHREYFDYLLKVSFHALLFNACLFLTYYIFSFRSISRYRFPCTIQKQLFFSWPFYLCLSWVTLGLFMYHNNIYSIENLGTALWYTNRGNNKVIGLLVNILVPLSSIAILYTIALKKYVVGFFVLIPIILIGFITGARSQIIGLALFVLYFFIWKTKNQKHNRLLLLRLAIVGAIVAYSMVFFRTESEAIYPFKKDVSYEDLFYAYKNSHYFTTEGSNTTRLILTGFYRYEAEDLTAVLASEKYVRDWGTLHPTLLGWAYIDLQEMFWLLALYFGVFIAFCDRLRYALHPKYNLMFLSFVFSFLSIALRGSVQYGYATIIYPFIIFLAFYLYHKSQSYAHPLHP